MSQVSSQLATLFSTSTVLPTNASVKPSLREVYEKLISGSVPKMGGHCAHPFANLQNSSASMGSKDQVCFRLRKDSTFWD